MTINAKTPSGWLSNDCFRFPCNKNEIECPIPQPGQNENPKFFIGQNVK